MSGQGNPFQFVVNNVFDPKAADEVIENGATKRFLPRRQKYSLMVVVDTRNVKIESEDGEITEKPDYMIMPLGNFRDEESIEQAVKNHKLGGLRQFNISACRTGTWNPLPPQSKKQVYHEEFLKKLLKREVEQNVGEEEKKLHSRVEEASEKMRERGEKTLKEQKEKDSLVPNKQYLPFKIHAEEKWFEQHKGKLKTLLVEHERSRKKMSEQEKKVYDELCSGQRTNHVYKDYAEDLLNSFQDPIFQAQPMQHINQGAADNTEDVHVQYLDSLDDLKQTLQPGERIMEMKNSDGSGSGGSGGRAFIKVGEPIFCDAPPSDNDSKTNDADN